MVRTEAWQTSFTRDGPKSVAPDSVVAETSHECAPAFHMAPEAARKR
jgi:hypothetical protein